MISKTYRCINSCVYKSFFFFSYIYILYKKSKYMETIIIIMAVIGTFASAIIIAWLLSLATYCLSNDYENKHNEIQFATCVDVDKEISDKWKEWLELGRKYQFLPSQARLNIAKKMTNDLSDEIGKYENK